MPLPTDPAWTPGPFTELRVHGVGNTPLERILDDPYPVRVAGDDMAAFYRRPGEAPSSGRRPVGRDGALTSTGDLEAYDWGGFSTGGGWRAFWVLLLPFTLVNLAGWMVWNRSKLGRKSVQLFGLGITIAFVTWLGAVLIDLIALQCGFQEACVDRQFWLKPLDWWGTTADDRLAIVMVLPLSMVLLLQWIGGRSHRRYEAATTVFSDAAVAWVTAVDPPTLQDPDTWYHDDPAARSFHAAAAIAALGGGMSFALWTAQHHPADLVLAIAGAALVLAAALVFTAFHTADPMTPGRTTASRERATLLWWFSILFIGVVGVMGITLSRGLPVAPEYASGWGIEPTSVQELGADTARILESNATIRAALFIANLWMIGLLVVAATIAILVHQRRQRTAEREGGEQRERALGGWGSMAASAAALTLVGVFVTGLAVPLAEFLGDRPSELLDAAGVDRDVCDAHLGVPMCDLMTRVPEDGRPHDAKQFLIETRALLAERFTTSVGSRTSTEAIVVVMAAAANEVDHLGRLSQPVIDPDVGLDLFAIGVLLLVALLLIGAVAIEIRVRTRIPTDRYPVCDELKPNAEIRLATRSEDERRRWYQAMARDLRKSPRNSRLVWLLLPLAIGIPALVVALNDRWYTPPYEWLVDRANWLITFAGVLTAAVGFLLAMAIRRSYQPEAQESFGGLWDVITFWPRRFHPFGVPAYGVRAVAELANRIDGLAGGRHATGRVLVSAHSGGVLISIAAIQMLHQDVRTRVALLTYGSPTGSLKGEVFPEFADAGELMKFAGMMTTGNDIRWRNLWRVTDWTGGYAFGPRSDRFANLTNPIATPESPAAMIIDTVEVYQTDPNHLRIAAVPDTELLPYPIGHTDYLHDPKYDGAEDPRYRAARKELVEMLYP